ncbi:MAG: hypothetical protein GC204_10565 [Chloroflexi bacterium]|nr:hypothetical protein [Chloroflexota bacterium]
MSNQPLACDLTALTDAQRARHLQVARQIVDLKQSVREFPDGYALQYDDEPANYLLLAEFMSLEHRCCPFFHLSLDVEPDQKAIWLHVGGSLDIKEFARMEMLS